MLDTTQPHSKTHPFLATVKTRYSLSKEGSKKRTQHCVLDLSGSGLTYTVGDSIGIFPVNDAGLVERTLDAMGANGQEEILEKNSDKTILLRDFLTRKANITEFSRKFVQELANRQTNPEKKEFLLGLLAEGNKDAFKNYQAQHEVWDSLAENKEAVFAPQDLCNLLMPLLPRLYSIASSMKDVGDEVHLTVALLTYETNGITRLGVCTHYLCNLAPLNEPVVPVYIQPHHGFTVPENTQTPMIMVGPGTGIAPFRAFMQERMMSQATGKHWLFFGEWNKDYDFFYEDYWKQLVGQDKLRVSTAFSRDQEHKVYVQHRMLEQGKELFQWLQEGAILYVCGDAHHMAKDVDAALHKIVQEHGALDEAGAKDFMKRLRQEKRYLRDVY